MANRILPVLLMLMGPLDVATGLLIGSYPGGATLMALASTILGVYLARTLWRDGATRLETRARLQLVSQQGAAFEADTETTQIYEENARLNYLLGAGLLGFGLALIICFIGSYLIVKPIKVNPTAIGEAVQIAVMLLFNFLVIGLQIFGARVFLKR